MELPDCNGQRNELQHRVQPLEEFCGCTEQQLSAQVPRACVAMPCRAQHIICYQYQQQKRFLSGFPLPADNSASSENSEKQDTLFSVLLPQPQNSQTSGLLREAAEGGCQILSKVALK